MLGGNGDVIDKKTLMSLTVLGAMFGVVLTASSPWSTTERRGRLLPVVRGRNDDMRHGSRGLAGG